MVLKRRWPLSCSQHPSWTFAKMLRPTWRQWLAHWPAGSRFKLDWHWYPKCKGCWFGSQQGFRFRWFPSWVLIPDSWFQIRDDQIKSNQNQISVSWSDYPLYSCQLFLRFYSALLATVARTASHFNPSRGPSPAYQSPPWSRIRQNDLSAWGTQQHQDTNPNLKLKPQTLPKHHVSYYDILMN